METFPRCVNCHQQFSLKGPIPYLLPCLHSACEPCVTSAAGGVIPCSSCHRDFDLSRTTLRKDIIRQREIFQLTVKHRSTELLCTNADDGNQAVSWCQECEELFCEHCQNMHDNVKATKKHCVQDLTDRKYTLTMKIPLCHIHESYPLDLFDKNCNLAICLKCKSSDHKDHDVEDIDVQYESAKACLATRKNNVRTQNEMYESEMKKMNELLTATDNVGEDVRARVEHAFESLKSSISQREKEVGIKLDSRIAERKQWLSNSCALLESGSAGCAEAQEYINNVLLFATKHELPELPELILKATDQYIDRKELRINDNISLDVNMEAQKKMIPMIPLLCRPLTAGTLTQDVSTQAGADYQEKEAVGLVHNFWNEPTCSYKKIVCTDIEFDIFKANNYVNINEAGELVNTPPKRSRDDTLKKYKGTCSKTRLHLIGNPQYWEVRSRVQLTRSLQENESRLILEIALCWEEERDLHHYVGPRSHSYSLYVGHLPKHSTIDCVIRHRGTVVTSVEDVLTNTDDTVAILHNGVLFDGENRQVSFIDVTNNTVIAALRDVDCSEPMWPMFGVYGIDNSHTAMNLVVGSAIVMTSKKRDMLLSLLN